MGFEFWVRELGNSSFGFWVLGERKIDARTFEFALLVVDGYKFLLGKKEFVLSKQFLRSGTSIGANVTEAQAAQSRKDFIKTVVSSKTQNPKPKTQNRLFNAQNPKPKTAFSTVVAEGSLAPVK